jgi:cytochrome d ubiquinol oxidase subunit I
METAMDLVFLSRLQFAFTTAFHILFPTFTIGLAFFLVVVEVLWLRSRDETYYRMYRFWVKIFALHFAVGVVSGITLEFEFGTNFSHFSQYVANVMAPLLAFEGMTAFFLEAGFLGIMLFGWNRVSPAVHFLSTCLVALGATLSSFWIMAANAWMQTPSGFEVVDGELVVRSFREVIFNPAFPTHLSHMILASYETTAFAIAGISAWFLLKKSHVAFYRRSLKIALIMAAVTAPAQVMIGDMKGLSTAEHQPAKLAAMEGHWETNTEGGAAFNLFAIPDMDAERNRLEISVPNGLSYLITHSREGRVQGLKDFPKEERPNALITYWSFRVMVGIGFLFIGVMVWALLLAVRKQLYHSRPFLKILVAVQPLGFLAVVMGWVTTEVGRQPWVVYGLMRTAEGVSPIHAGNVLWSLSVFILFFGIIGASYFYYILKILRNGPDLSSPIPPVQMPSGMRPVEDVLKEV